MPVINVRACTKAHISSWVLSPTSSSHDRFIICACPMLAKMTGPFHCIAPLYSPFLCGRVHGLNTLREFSAYLINKRCGAEWEYDAEDGDPALTVHDCTLIRSLSCAERANVNCTILRIFMRTRGGDTKRHCCVSPFVLVC